ncbi:MAG: DUF4910 domain-containing protein [Erysipelotrichaceae bacterium]|nr:DUF4910 domain-containing protein [Erysipelotrichaceae bacterium]
MKDPEVFRKAVSEKRLLNVVKEVSNYHRIQASPMFREAAEHVLSLAKSYGLDAKILSYEADPNVWYLQNKMFKEWSVKEATLDLVDPDMRLADFSAEPVSLIQKSYPIDRRDDPVDLVYLDKGNKKEDYEGLDLDGCFVFVHGHINGYNWVYDKGALGIVTDYIMETPDRKRSDLYDSLTYTSYWHTHSKDEKERRGFVLSPKTGDALAALCLKKREEGTLLKVKPHIDSSLYNGHIEIVEITIPGKDDKNVYLSAHLCHPRSSCNDNASGTSAALEAMNVLNSLIREGKIERPRHNIICTLVPEFTGTFAYLSDHIDYEKGLGGLNMDMVGGRQNRTYGPITLTKTPYALPSMINEMTMAALENAGREATSLQGEAIALTNSRIEGHIGGSDHAVYCDPLIGIPCCMLGQWPDRNYHTATDTLDVIDPAVLKFSCLTAVNFLYSLADLTQEDVPYLFAKQDEHMVLEKTRAQRKHLDGAISKEMYGSLLCMLKEYFLECADSLKTFFPEFDTGMRKNTICSLFDNWIAEEDLQDDYACREGNDTVYRRKFLGPVHLLEDYRVLGYGELIDEYEKKTRTGDFDLMGVENSTVYFIDGKRTAGQIAKLVSLELKKDVSEKVLLYLELLEGMNLLSGVR